MKLAITRNKSAPTGTPGHLLVIETRFTCDTLELPWHDNRRRISCIIADMYEGRIWRSPSLDRDVVRLEDKHGRADCLLHNGNYAGDEALGYRTQVHGCTLVGRGLGLIDGQFGIMNSKATLQALIDNIGKGPHEVTYVWDEGCAP